MIKRKLEESLLKSMKQFPAVAILGPRQVGKTTLAKVLGSHSKKNIIYLDLENPRHLERLHDPHTFLQENRSSLIIIDEIQRMPELFAILRPVIDEYRKPGRFVLTGSASPQLIKGVSESLTGRIAFTELTPVGLLEIPVGIKVNQHWFRGGFPKALITKSNEQFAEWMDYFIRSYIERDLQELFDVNFTRSVMRNFWRMIAHSNGGIWNAHNFARSLGITAPTVSRYLDFLEGAFLVHKLPAYYFNAKKRIIKSPKIYIRDSGILHRLDNINRFSDLPGNPVIGSSWEGYVIEQIYQSKKRNMDLYYYRTQNGAEADIVITKSSKPICCIEIKLSNTPSVNKGFYECISDLKTKHNFLITPENEPFTYSKSLTVCGIKPFLTLFLNNL